MIRAPNGFSGSFDCTYVFISCFSLARALFIQDMYTVITYLAQIALPLPGNFIKNQNIYQFNAKIINIITVFPPIDLIYTQNILFNHPQQQLRNVKNLNMSIFRERSLIPFLGNLISLKLDTTVFLCKDLIHSALITENGLPKIFCLPTYTN